MPASTPAPNAPAAGERPAAEPAIAAETGDGAKEAQAGVPLLEEMDED